LQKASNPSERLGAAWTSLDPFVFDLDLTDGQPHELSLYVVDWDQVDERTEQITIVDAETQAVLDQQQVDSFTSGIYLRWQVRGHIQIKVEWTFGGYNAVVSGLFLDAGSGAGSTLDRAVTYTYDGLQRLVGATQQTTMPLSATTVFSYTYDDAGNRTGVWQDGLQTQRAAIVWNVSHTPACDCGRKLTSHL
jgi:hypothetical protein